ncbi:MAG: DUF4924 domain-containing protein [Bacteroidia bacterium]|nr:MAG: DUF4924 domain-containing protein [Bacteroidia bacterium]
MFISQQLKKENIAEYILYMWQVEDLLRSFAFDTDKIEENIINRYPVSDTQKQEVTNWYSNLIQMAELENKKESGHLQIFINIVCDLNDLHSWLLYRQQDIEYEKIYSDTQPELEALYEKMEGKIINEVDMCLQGIYAFMLMRLQKKEISTETENAMYKITRLIAYLSAKYADREENPDKYYE